MGIHINSSYAAQLKATHENVHINLLHSTRYIILLIQFRSLISGQYDFNAQFFTNKFKTF